MKSLTEKLCFTVMVNDFLHFSYAYEKSERNFKSYCATEFGIDIDYLFLTPDVEERFLKSFVTAFEIVNREIPFCFGSVKPVMTHFLNSEQGVVPSFRPGELFNGKVNYPDSALSNCDEIVSKSMTAVKELLLNSCSFESLFITLENYCTYFSVDDGVTSFFEFLKLKAGHASIILHQLMKNTNERALLICSFDFLGIKDFKFAECLKNDLCLMQTASLYIDIFRENVLDEFFDYIGLTRANIVFTGGRHIHMYLPFFDGVEHMIDSFIKSLNDWCVDNHKVELYVSYGYVKTTVNDLRSFHKPDNYYLRLFEMIASIKAEVESAKYTPDNIHSINAKNRMYASEGVQMAFANQLAALHRYYCDCGCAGIDIISSDEGIPIFPGQYISLKKVPYSSVIRRYCDKTSVCIFDRKDVGIWMMLKKEQLSFETIANGGKIGVLRIDIDDFRKKMLSYGQNAEKSLPNAEFKMMLSKEFAIFLRYYIYILADEYENITIIHEGADDVFIVGEANALLEFSFCLSSQYRRYTNNAMTISGGYTIFDKKNRFIDTANEAQELMNKSKTVNGKNAITILNSSTTYKWDEVDQNAIVSF